MTMLVKHSRRACLMGRASILLGIVVAAVGLHSCGVAAQPFADAPGAQGNVETVEAALKAITQARDNPRTGRTVLKAHWPTLVDAIYARDGEFSWSVVLRIRILGRAMDEVGEYLPPELEETLFYVAHNEDFGRLERSGAAEAVGYIRPLSDEAIGQLIAMTRQEETSNGAWRSLGRLIDESHDVREFILKVLKRGGARSLLDTRQTFDLDLLEALTEGIMTTGIRGAGGFAYLRRFEDHIPNRQRLYQRVAETAMDTSEDPNWRGGALSILHRMSSEDAKAALGEAISAILEEPSADTNLLRLAIRYSLKAADHMPDREALLTAIAEGTDPDMATEAAHALQGRIP